MKKEKIIKIIKLIILLAMIGLAYIVADKFIDYIMTVDVIILKRVVNIILVIISTAIYFKK